MQSFTSVPFKTETHHGLSSINGVAKFSAAGIVLEFEAKLFGLIGGGVKEVRLAKGDILDVKFKKGIFKRSAKIEIRTITFTKLAELPNSDGKLTLNIVRDDIERSEAAVAQLQKEISEYVESLPPPQTPVSALFADESEDETKLLEHDKQI
ncbi:MAG: hypothetical protein ACRD6X_04035 [Pyrinomonadaceae bacterium]